MKVTIRLMIYNPTNKKWRQQFSLSRKAPQGMGDVTEIYLAIKEFTPVRNLAVMKEDGGIIRISSDDGRLSLGDIATLRRFVLKMIHKQIPPQPQPPRRSRR